MDPEDFYYAQHHSEGDFNFQKYSNPEVDRLLEAGQEETGKKARKKRYAEAARKIADDASYIYLYNPDVVQAWAPQLKGYKARSDAAIRFRDVGLSRLMLRFSLLRAGHAAVVLLGVTVVVFALMHLVPGDPVRVALGTQYTQESYEALREASGLDRPLVSQYFHYVGSALTGDLGVSFRTGEPVTLVLLERLPATLSLAFAAMAVALGIAVPAGRLRGDAPGARSATRSCASSANSGSPYPTSGWASCSSCCSPARWAGCRPRATCR